MKDRLALLPDMEETGYILPFQLLIPLTVLPMAAIVCLLIRGSYKIESFFLLLGLNILLFLSAIFNYLPVFNFSNTVNNSPFFWKTGEYILIALLFRSYLKKHIPVQWIQYLIVIHITVIATLAFTRNLIPNMELISIASALEISLFALVSLVVLVKTRYLFIFESPLFWIAAGTLFYYFIFLAVEASLNLQWIDETIIKEKPPLLAAFSIVRLLFYLISCMVTPTKNIEIKN